MAFSPQFLDELRARIGLADVIGRRVRLIRKGREHSGLCPFHNEKTPSFTVNEEKGFYHCFGCGAHGSVFDFVMQLDKLSFPEAVERLAAEAGMEVPQSSFTDRERDQRAKGLLDVVEAACKFFERQLRLPEGKQALEYLRGRGIRDEMIQRFRLGFSPDGRGALKAHLAREGVREDAMIEAGLVIRPDDESRGTYDRFRGRVMFPIMDARGRVIAFGGRVMGQGEPKYLNSPETPLFHKGFNLYGLAQGLAAIRERNQAIVVEGYTDVIALHQAGIATALAPLGTALTEDQMKLLWRHTAEPILCFDGDAAGQRAAARAAERALPILLPGKGLRFVELPAGEDPDTLVRGRGATAMADVLRTARPLSDVLWSIEVRGQRIETPEARAGLDARFRELAGRIADETMRRHYQTAFRDRVWDLYKTARQKGSGRQGMGRSPGSGLADRAGAVTRIDPLRLQEEILLATLIGHPGLQDSVAEELGALAFASTDLDRLRQDVLKLLSVSPDLDAKALEDQLCRTGYSELLSGLMSRRVFTHARFARPDEPEDYAERGWKQLYRLYRRSQLLKEIEAVTDLCGIEGGEGNFALLKALKEEAASLVAGSAVGTDDVNNASNANDAA
jgi:DNA primase